VPGDKSVSHRAVLLGSVNDGPVSVSGFLRSADTLATVAAARALGVEIEEEGSDLVVHGQGWDGLHEPSDVIDVRNAGTLIRLLPDWLRRYRSCVYSPAMPVSGAGPWVGCLRRLAKWA